MPFLEYEKCNPKISLGYNSLKLLSEKSIAKRYSLLISKDWYSQTHPIDVDIHKKITVLDNKIKKNIILDLFSKTVRTDIGIVLLKGNALNLIYGDYKKNSDVDILILKNRSEFEEILLLNFTPIAAKNSKYTSLQQVTWQHKKLKDQYIDLHFSLSNSLFFDVNSEDIKTNIENISIDGIKITILSPEMTIINFLMQMILDGNINHYGIIDIDIVLSISKINKDELTRLIDSYGLKKYISIFHPNIYKTAYGEEHTHTLYDKAMKLVLNKFFHVQPGNFGTLHKFKKLLLWSLIIENSSLSKLYRKSKGC